MDFKIKKFILSAFVVLSFGFYAIYDTYINNQKSALPIVTDNQPVLPLQNPSSTQIKQGKYKDGQYTGDSVDAYYGNVQVKVIIQNGRITDVRFLDYPQDRSNSTRISNRAMPQLTQEAISAQSANVNGVSGASETSQAFVKSLTSALNQAS